MQEQAIIISSIKRQKKGRSRPEDFTIKFNPPMHLDSNMQYELASDRASMTYSWRNINAAYGNKTIKYSKDGGTSWKTISFVDGMYSYDDQNDYINQAIAQNGDKPDDGNSIKIYFVLSSYCVVEIMKQWQLDIRNSSFGDLIGFEPKILTKTGYSTKLTNITNNIDSIHINCDLITNSITDGKFGNMLAIIPTDNLTRSYPFTFEPRRALFSPVFKTIISEMHIAVTDSIGRLIDLNNIDWYMSLILRLSLM